ncbi:hypothetical protein MKY59_16345 [Paenibacillus sp. FSL W8-0426]
MTLIQKRIVILIVVMIAAAILGRLAMRAFLILCSAVHCSVVTSYEK